MTISSALVSFATGDPRQTPASGAADPAAANSVPTLQSGPWSAIDWEFGSVLQALMPDGTDEPVRTGTEPEKADSPKAIGTPAALPQTLSGLPNALPANLLFALQRAIAPETVVAQNEPAVVSTAVDVPATVPVGKTDASLVKTVVAEAKPFRATPRLNTPVPIVKTAPEATVKSVPVRTSDIAPLLRLSVVSTSQNVLDAEVISKTPALTSDVVPTLTPSPLPPGIRVAPQSTNAESSAKPATTDTIDAEIVSTPTAPIFATVPKVVETSAAPVKEDAPEADATGTPQVRASDVAPTIVPGLIPQEVAVQPQPKAAQSESTLEAEVVSTPSLKPQPQAVRVESQVKDVERSVVRENKKSVVGFPKTAPSEPDSATPATRLVAEPLPVKLGTATVPQVKVPAAEIKSEPAAAPKTEKPASHLEPAAVRVTEHTERQAVPETETKSTKENPAPAVAPAPSIPLPVITEEPVVAVETKSETKDDAPIVTMTAEIQPIPAVAASSPTQNIAAPVTQTVAPAAAALRPIAPERRSEDPAKSEPAAFIAVDAPRPERIPAEAAPDPSTPTANHKSTDSSPLVELSGKSDQPSPNDTEIAFTGRLVPRKPAEEPVTRSESVEPKLEKLAGPAPIRELQDAPVDRPVEHEHPVLRSEPNVIVPTVHRDAAPATTDRSAEVLHAGRAANTEIIQEPAKADTPGPVHEISMRVNDQAQDSAHLRVVEKGGEVTVSVRTGSEQLARTLSSDLGELTHRLEQTGFQAELFRPSATSSSSEPGQDRRENSATGDQNANQSWSRERRDSQQHPGQHAREWVDDLEESMGLSQ